MTSFKICLEANVVISGLAYKNEMTNMQPGDILVANNHGNASASIEIHRNSEKMQIRVQADKLIFPSRRSVSNDGQVDSVTCVNAKGVVTNIFSKEFLHSLFPWADINGHNDKDNNSHVAKFFIDEVNLLAKIL